LVAETAARVRLDVALVERGLVDSREKAQALVRAGLVRLNGERAERVDQRVGADAELELLGRPRFVGRGGEKLEGVLDALGVEAGGRTCLDAGASTGGFTDVLLQRGAARVYAVDVGYGQLDWRLRQDPRVVVLERTNIRELAELPGPAPALAVADLSFIALRKVLDDLRRLCAAAAEMVLLVKPQFELGRGRVGSGGIVRDPADREEAVNSVLEFAAGAGFTVLGRAQSPLPGARGNVETFVHLRGPAGG
jgi:23S rRNA (cytidine1920-2'-O)/16S rRNA (cytidine1409-2'-O)-methyltransferase